MMKSQKFNTMASSVYKVHAVFWKRWQGVKLSCINLMCFVVSFAGVLGARAHAADPQAAAPCSFAATVEPYFQQHCIKCHGPEKQKGKLALHALDRDVAAGKDADRWTVIAEKIALGEMPPETEPRPSPHASGKVLEWIKAELARAGKKLPDVGQKLVSPAQGNRIDHDALFDSGTEYFASSPARLWRLSPELYSAFASKTRDAKTAQPFSSSPAPGFKDYADLFVIDEPTIGQLFRNASAIVAMQTREKGGVKEFAPLLQKDKPPTADQVTAGLKKQFQLVLRREPTTDELSRFAALYEKNAADAGRDIGGRATLSAVLMLPEALYRMELGRGQPDEHGRRMLAPRELAFAVGYALGDEGPDDKLLKTAAEGKLQSREDVAREVQRLLTEPKFRRTRIPRFFDEFFEFPRANEVFKDVPKGMEWRPDVFVNDTRLLIQHILAEDKDVFRQLLTTNKSFVNYNDRERKPARIINTDREKQVAEAKKKGKEPPPLRPEYHEVYNLPPEWKWTAEQPVELPGSQRAGILTQPSWLAAMATNNENHAILRGKWVRERLLGGHIPDLPITVDAQLPDKPEQTLRQRMAVTQQEYCWQCHQKMNPLGLTFENFDYLGRFRTAEPVLDIEATAKNVDKKGQPLGPVLREVPAETVGLIDGSGNAKVDGAVDDSVAMIHRIANSDRARQMFIRHAFRYWMGRNERLSDAPTLVAADKAYLESGGSMKALIVSLLTSDSFLYRTDVE